VYDDPRGGKFRAELYPRLRAHFQFWNGLFLFKEVHDQTRFSVNIYGKFQDNIFFQHLANLYSPKTIDASFDHDGNGLVPGIKDEENKWNTQGHLNRIIQISEEELKLFSTLYDEPETPYMQARLPALHSQEFVSVLKKFASQPKRLGDLNNEYYSTQMWNETISQEDGTIQRSTRFPELPEEWIISGPHFYVANPFYKTPRSKCSKNSDYDVLDLSSLPDDYLPRTNYIPACSKEEYLRRTPRVPWDGRPVIEFYRFVYRAMLPPPNERTLFGAIYPPNTAHTNACRSYVFSDDAFLEGMLFCGCTYSIPYDFFTKVTGRTNLHQILDTYPLISFKGFDNYILLRTLCLNCLTIHYSSLWLDCWNDEFRNDRWAKNDPRLDNSFFPK
jgi:hypothetical protein